jgi:Phage Terminase
MARALGLQNRTNKALDSGLPPWRRWRTRDPAERCIRFIEAYVRIPTGHGAGEPLRLHPFQKVVIRALLAGNVGAWQVCRGNAKSTLIAAIGLWALCDEPYGPQVPLIAHDAKHAERTLFTPIQQMIRASPALADRLTVYTASGDKRVHSWWNGGDLLPLPADEDRLQGLNPTVAIIDEAQTVPAGVYWTVRQGGGKRPNSLVILIGTPGPDLTSALYQFRQLHLAGGGGVWLEHSAARELDPFDPATWRRANPALAAGFLAEHVIADEALAARLDPVAEHAFRTYRLGQWPDDGLAMDPLSRALRAAESSESRPEGALVWSVDSGFQSGSESFLGVSDGRCVQLVDHRPGTGWVQGRLAELVDRHGGVVVLDRGGTIAQRLPDLAQAVPVHDLNAVEVARACSRFEEDLLEGRLVVAKGDTEALRAAVAGVQRHGTGDTWRWFRRKALDEGGVDLAPLYAVTLAWWVGVTQPVPGVG